jgi:tetratricopeptide (TPR) repeat protein
MAAERRHDQHDHHAENDLAASTVDLLAWLRPHLQTLGIAAAVLVGAYAAWTLIAAQRRATAERSWDDCMAALGEQDPARLEEVIRQYPGSPAARWSQMLLAEAAITEGCQQLFGDRERARQRLGNAVDLYTAILAEQPGGLIEERAVFGLAKAREALGELDQARRGYETLVAEYPQSAVRGLATQRLAALSRGATPEWYAWFSEQDMSPPPAAPESAAPETSDTDVRPEPAAADPAGSPDASGEQAAAVPAAKPEPDAKPEPKPEPAAKPEPEAGPEPAAKPDAAAG